MTDLPDHVIADLAGRYRIARQAGSGGMATVFVAEDVRHHREVAIKVLRPELASSVGGDRFLREIAIAAGLQHPHVLPLYDSGEAAGQLYYVMPFVDGPSLRDRLAREGALPLADALRLLREIADALAYAHGRGLVHRDIKPENILLSGGHALVADFGVAKALHDAAGSASMTGTGIALGTPAYMAPEQAMADPGLDHRADLYALGVVAYEMFAGAPPFAATNAAQLVAAHLTQAPPPLAERRPEVPAVVADAVMRCLEKDPTARWATAAELRDALDALVTPIGTPSVATSGGARAPAAPAMPRAADGGPGLAAPATPSPSAPPRRTRLIAASAAVAVLALGLLGVTRYTATGRAGTLIGNDVLAANDLVLVAEFQNRTPDTTLGATVTDAVRSELAQSRTVQVLPQGAMWAALRRMGLDRGVALPEPKVQELAEREGAKAYVVGDIARLGAGWQIAARVVATKGGAEPLTVRATASGDGDLIAALETVGRKLREGIGESLRSVASTPALAQVTTPSLAALRLYTSASREELRGDRPRAVSEARQAIALDSGFAAAWALLGVIYSNMDSIAASTRALRQAFAFADRLPEEGRLVATARVRRIEGNVVEEEAAWRSLAALGRQETNYANFLLQHGRVQEAEVMARRAVASGAPNSITYWNLAEALAAQHKWAAVDSVTRIVQARMPDNLYRWFIPFSALVARRDYVAAERLMDTTEMRTLPAFENARCTMALLHGRLSRFAECSRQLPGYLDGNPTIAMAALRLTGDTAAARAAWTRFLAAPVASRGLDAYAGTIALLADAGRVREARQLYEEWRTRAGTANDPGFRTDSGRALGAMLAAEGKWKEALAAFAAWHAAPSQGARNWYNRGWPESAAIYRRMGQPDSAIALYERALGTASMVASMLYEVEWYPEALVALGTLHEQQGHRERAIEYYRTYLSLMKDADGALARQVATVRDRVFTLGGEPAGRP